MRSSPLFRLKGADVKESNPIIDISEEAVSLQVTLDGKAVANMLNDFEDHSWVSSPTDASCQVTWQQEINEIGVRKSFHCFVNPSKLRILKKHLLHWMYGDSAEFAHHQSA
ncbi:hypothetical protein O9992_04740 [Vibrio lentus]|nr:hypothetical protein [Vibrio lentus]